MAISSTPKKNLDDANYFADDSLGCSPNFDKDKYSCSFHLHIILKGKST